MHKLNLGSGKLKREGFVNIDWDASSTPDVLHDLNLVPYPLASSAFDYVEASHVLEHLDRPFEVMKEIHRVLKPGGVLAMKVPHFSRGLTHAEHAHGFDVTFPLYFRRDFLGSGYQGVEFRLTKLELHWSAFAYLLPNLGYGVFTTYLLKTMNAVISFVANLNPYFCSRIWCFWVGGFEELEFQFVCVK